MNSPETQSNRAPEGSDRADFLALSHSAWILAVLAVDRGRETVKGLLANLAELEENGIARREDTDAKAAYKIAEGFESTSDSAA